MMEWDDFPFPTVSGKSFKIPWFQSPPTSITIIFPLLLVYNLLTTINHHYQSLLTTNAWGIVEKIDFPEQLPMILPGF